MVIKNNFRETKMTRSSLLLALSVILAWGLWSVIAKIGVERLGPFKYLFYSQLIASLIVLGFLAFRGNYRLNPGDYSYFGYPVFDGMVSALAIFMLYLLLSKEAGSIAVSLTAIYPIVTIFILVVILRIETLTFQQWVGAFLAILGAFLLSL